MTHKDAPPETASQAACRTWWETNQPHVKRAWGRAKDGSFFAEESRLLHSAWIASQPQAPAAVEPETVCNACKGVGEIPQDVCISPDPQDGYTVEMPCTECDGTGVARPAPEKVIEAPEIDSWWIHTNGKQYQVKALANIAFHNPRYPVAVIYRGEYGHWWARPLTDWHRSFTRA